jgi:hypothetical protein
MSSGAACLTRPVRGSATQRPVVASTALRPVLAAPPGAVAPGAAAQGRVLAALPSALYVAVADEVVAVVTRDAVRLPNAAVLPQPAAQAPFAVHVAGAAAEVWDGALHVATQEGGQVAYRPVREWAPRPVLPGQPASVRASVVDDLARRLGPAACRSPTATRLATATADLQSALLAGDLRGARAAADRLVGLGPGLTPAGDDVLAGLLVTCRQLRAGPAAARVVALAEALGEHVVRRASTRTTALSATLLLHAAQGRAAAQVLAVVDALVGRAPLGPALTALLPVGHTSGRDTARGVLAAAVALGAQR